MQAYFTVKVNSLSTQIRKQQPKRNKKTKKMASSFLTPRAPDQKGSDTLSEIGSESGTTTSGWTSGWDSREDLRDFATKIGLKDVTDLYQDRFRVNRKKLEQMLSGKSKKNIFF